MSLLECIAAAEVVVLLTAGLFLLIGYAISRSEPDDQLYHFVRAFWRYFLHRPAPFVPVALRPVKPGKPIIQDDLQVLFPDDADEEDAVPAWEPQLPSDSFYGRVRKSKDGRVLTASIAVKVVPAAGSDQIVGRYGPNALKVRVAAPAEAGKANKAVIQILADALDVKAYQVQLIRGHYHPRKVLRVTGLSQAEVNAKLTNFR